MRGILENIYFSIIQAQVWVALCFTLLCFYFQLINEHYNEQLIWLAYFSTLVAYNFAHWFTKKYELWRIPIMLLSIIACLLFAVQGLNLTTWILLIFLGLISILYTLPIHNHNLRQIPGFKILWIAMVWSLAIMLSWLESDKIEWWPMLWQSMSVFFFVIGITIPFDIRDIELDLDRLQTIPQVIGVDRSIRLSTQTLMLSATCFLISVRFDIGPDMLAFLISILIAIAFVRRSSTKMSKWFVTFWIEGLSLLPFILYQIFY